MSRGVAEGAREPSTVKSAVLSCLGALSGLAEDTDVPAFVHEAQEARGRLEDERFHLAVMGQFKRGKSTLINALLGEALLPTGVVPLTSVATEIRFGERRQATVVFEDGRRETVPTGDIAFYVTEKHNPENKKGVWRVEVRFPAPLLREGMVISDTPGLGSVYSHNTRTALDYLPQADAVVVVLAVDPPVSEAELDFVSQARAYVDRAFFLLNKIDYVSDAEREEALAFTREALARRLDGAAVSVRPISARLALEAKLSGDRGKMTRSHFAEFEADLQGFMGRAKGKEILKAAARRASRLVAELENHFRAEEAALETPLAVLEERLAKLGAALDQARAQHREALFILKGEIDALLRLLDEDIDRFRAEETKTLQARASEFLAARKDAPLKETLSGLEDFRSARLVADFEAWRQGEEKALNSRLNEIGVRFEARTSELVDRVRHAAAEIFGARLASVTESSSLATESRLWYLTGDISTAFLPELNLLTFSPVLPRRVVLRWIARDLRRSVAAEVDRNCGRVRYDLLERIEETGRRMEGRLEDRFEATISGITAGITRAAADRRKGDAQVQASLRRVRAQLAQVDKARDTLRAVCEKLFPDGGPREPAGEP